MKILSKIAESVATVSAVIIFVLAIVFAAPMGFGYEPRIVLSSSMEPMIEVGSVVYIDKNDVVPEIGKVVAFAVDTTEGENHVIHRIVERRDNGYVTRGDNNEADDLVLLKPEKIIGTYSYHIPKLGYLIANRLAFIVGVVMWLLGWAGLSVLFDIGSR